MTYLGVNMWSRGQAAIVAAVVLVPMGVTFAEVHQTAKASAVCDPDLRAWAGYLAAERNAATHEGDPLKDWSTIGAYLADNNQQAAAGAATRVSFALDAGRAPDPTDMSAVADGMDQATSDCR